MTDAKHTNPLNAPVSRRTAVKAAFSTAAFGVAAFALAGLD